MVFLGLLTLIIITSSIFLTSKNESSQKKSSIDTKPVQVKELTKEQVTANKIISWIDTQKNEKGVYSNGLFCQEKDCNKYQPSVYAPRVGVFPLWGKLKYINATGNQINLSSEIDAILNSELQFDSYNCKFMFELYKSSIINSDEKNKVADICRTSGYESMSHNFYQNLSIDQLDTLIKSKIVSIASGQKYSLEESYDTEELKEFLTKAAALTVEYTVRKEWESIINKNDSTELIQRFNNLSRSEFAVALDAYNISEKNLLNDSVIGIAAINLYNDTKNNLYLYLARRLYAKNAENYLKNDSDSEVYYAWFGYELTNATSENIQPSYQSVVNNILTGFFDSTKNAIKSRTGHYSTVENSLMVGLLSTL